MATFTESFNKADGVGLGPDLTWTATDPGSNWATSSNQGVITGTTAAEPIARAEADTGSANMYVQLVLPDFGTSSYCDIGLCVRVSADRQTRYTFKRAAAASGPGYEIRKYVSGTLTTLVDVNGSPAFAFPETLRIEVEGTDIRVYRNAVLLDSIIDADIAAGSFGGLDGFRNNANATRRVIFDSFEVGSLADGPANVALTPAVVTAVGVALDAVPQPVTVTLTPAVTVASPVAVSPVPQPVTVILTPAAASVTAVPLATGAGAGEVALTPAVVAVLAVTTAGAPQPVTVALVSTMSACIALVLDPQPQPVTVKLGPAQVLVSAAALFIGEIPQAPEVLVLASIRLPLGLASVADRRVLTAAS